MNIRTLKIKSIAYSIITPDYDREIGSKVKLKSKKKYLKKKNISFYYNELKTKKINFDCKCDRL